MTCADRPDLRRAAAAAFRIFLGRAPAPGNPLDYDGPHEMHRMLARSAEFRASQRSRKTPLGWPLAQVFVSKPARVIYCPIGKNACTFLKSEVARTTQPEHWAYLLRDIHFITDHVRTGLQLSDYPVEEVQQLIQDDSYLKVAVLREPMDRLLSAYIEKFVMGRLGPANIHHTRSVIDPVQAAQGLETPDYDRGITFRDFIGHVTGTDPRRLDPHWRPQTHYLQGITYDRLFRMDQINELMEILEERSGVALERQPRNVTGSGKGQEQSGAMDLLPAEIAAGPKLLKASFFDAAMQQAVETAFASDYELLQQTEGQSR